MVEELTEKQQTTNVPLEQPVKSRSGLWIGIIVLLVVVLMAGAGFYLLQQLRSQGDDINKEDQRNIENAKQISGFQTQLASMQSQLTQATATISNADDRLDSKLAEFTKINDEKLETTRKDLTGAVVQVQRQLGKTRGDWLIADAEYLLSVAGQRLHLIGDLETTREALEAADQRLRESGDAGAFKVREQIAKELALLRSIPTIDFVGMYSTLQSLSHQVEQLTLFLPHQGKAVAKPSEHDKHSAPSQTSSELLNLALRQVDGYVTVRHTEQPIKAILTAEQVQFIRQELRLKLELVKVALVQKNQLLYQTSLKDASDWLAKNFNQNAQTKDFRAQLEKLQMIQLNAQMPDISLSLKMLRDITKLRIETDKVLPAHNVELKIDSPKVEELKPVVSEKPVISVPEKNVEKPQAEVKTESAPKVVDAKPADAASEKAKPDVKIDSPVEKAAAVEKTPPKTEDKETQKKNAPLVIKTSVTH